MKLRVLQPVYFLGAKRGVGEILDVDAQDLPNREVPRWAVVDEQTMLPGAGHRGAEPLAFGRAPRAVSEREAEPLEFA